MQIYMEQPFIPSIIYREVIDKSCVSIARCGQAKYFVVYLLFNNGKKFILSNTPMDFLSLYWHERYKLKDYSADLKSFGDKDYFLCKEKLAADQAFKEMMEIKFSMHRTYYATRNSPECRIVFGILHNHEIVNPQQIYKNTINEAEDICIQLLDQMIDIIKLHNPEYNRSIILNDKYYRRSIIKNLYNQAQQLSEREIECLYWVAQGKSSEETAIIMKNKKSTIETYRNRIKDKLNCTNMAQAVYEGVKRGYIGAFNANYLE